MSECNCPSLADVARGPIYSKDPCPVHDNSDGTPKISLVDLIAPLKPVEFPISRQPHKRGRARRS